MDTELKKAFQNAIYQPELKLSDDMWRAIIAYQKRRMKIIFWAAFCIGAASFAALIPIVQAIRIGFSQSGFYDYSSLLFSDSGSFASYWKEISLSLFSSIPFLAITLFVGIIFVILFASKQAVKNIRGVSFYKFNV